VKGWGPLSTGVRLLPVAMCVAAASIGGSRLAIRVGTKLVVGAGLMLMAAFYLWVTETSTGTSYLTIAAQMVVLGTGMGLASAPATEAIMGVVPKTKAGVGSAVNDATRLLGGTLGVAIIGSVYTSLFTARLADRQPAGLPHGLGRIAQSSVGASLEVSTRLAHAGETGLADAMRAATRAAFFHGFHAGNVVSAGVAAAGAVIALLFLPADHAAPDPQPSPHAPTEAEPISAGALS
jgi:hypothetical protein